jgi:hypothetical protein
MTWKGSWGPLLGLPLSSSESAKLKAREYCYFLGWEERERAREEGRQGGESILISLHISYFVKKKKHRPRDAIICHLAAHPVKNCDDFFTNMFYFQGSFHVF